MLVIARGWLVFDLTESEFLVTLVSAAALFPALFLSILGGVIADRFSRKYILLVSEASNFITLIALAALVALDVIEVWHLIVLAVGNGITFSLASPARFSMVPSLVPPQHIANATALSSIMFSGGALLGPPLAGFLLGVDPALAFLAGAILVGLAVPLFILMKPGQAPQWGQSMRPQGGVLQNIVEGLRHIKERQILLGLVVLGLVVTFFGMPYQALLPVFAEEVLEVGPQGLGLLGMAGGVGGIIGSLAIATFSSVNQLKGWLVIGAIGVGIFIAGFAQSEWLASQFGMSLTGALIIALIFAAGAGLVLPAGYDGQLLPGAGADAGLPERARNERTPYRFRDAAVCADHYGCHCGGLWSAACRHADGSVGVHLLSDRARCLPGPSNGPQ